MLQALDTQRLVSESFLFFVDPLSCAIHVLPCDILSWMSH